MKNHIKTVELYEIQPADFRPQVQVAACYVEHGGCLLLLQRAANKTEPGQWGVPAGKLELGETAEHAARRELLEETGISLDANSKVSYLRSLYIRKPNIDYIYYMFKVTFTSKPEVSLNNEHQAYHWASQLDIADMPLMAGARESLEYYRIDLQKEFYFIRHGQTDHNVLEGQDKGVHPDDSPLNLTGIEQAKRAKPVIDSLPIRTVCLSPLRRVRETVDVVMSDRSFNHCVIDNLGECSAQIWHEMVHTKIHGDPTEQFISRVKTGLNQARSMPGPVLIVAHGGVHWAICHLLGIEEHDWAIGNCVPVRFSLNDNGEWAASYQSNALTVHHFL